MQPAAPHCRCSSWSCCYCCWWWWRGVDGGMWLLLAGGEGTCGGAGARTRVERSDGASNAAARILCGGSLGGTGSAAQACGIDALEAVPVDGAAAAPLR